MHHHAHKAHSRLSRVPSRVSPPPPSVARHVRDRVTACATARLRARVFTTRLHDARVPSRPRVPTRARARRTRHFITRVGRHVRVELQDVLRRRRRAARADVDVATRCVRAGARAGGRSNASRARVETTRRNDASDGFLRAVARARRGERAEGTMGAVALALARRAARARGDGTRVGGRMMEDMICARLTDIFARGRRRRRRPGRRSTRTTVGK